MNTAPIFQTMTTTGVLAHVEIQQHAENTMPLLVVRDIRGTVTKCLHTVTCINIRVGRPCALTDETGTVMMALPIHHVSDLILSSLFDAVDTATILQRCGESIYA